MDLDYNLPIGVRDKVLGMDEEHMLPESDIGKEFALRRMEESGELVDKSRFTGGAAQNALLARLARTDNSTNNYARNKAKVCTFWLRGECRRGAECPYRHEQPEHKQEGSHLQNIRDRYYGTNDATADKILTKVNATKEQLVPPTDTSITTLWVGGVTGDISEEDLKGAFYMHGELKGIKKLEARNCAFVTYVTREAAEKAVEELGGGKLAIKGFSMKLLWGKPRKNNNKNNGGDGGQQQQQAAPPPPPGQLTYAQAARAYPSMDPTAGGSRVEVEVEPGEKEGDGSGKKRHLRDGDDREPRNKKQAT